MTAHLRATSSTNAHSTKSTRRRIQKRRHILVITAGVLAVALVLGLALGVGLGVGLSKHSNEDSRDNAASSSSSSSSDNSSLIGNSTGGVDKNGKWTGWQPEAGTTWQIELAGVPDSFAPRDTYALYDLDLFALTPENINTLHEAGQRVICYFSAGTVEDFRPDASTIPKAAVGDELVDWPGERWLDTSDAGVRGVMRKRMEMARSKGCDGVDPDNVDGYDNDNGLGLTKEMAIDYVHWLSSTAHSLGMACGLKNGGGIVPDVLDSVEFSVQEQCVETQECAQYRPFVDAGKAVLHIEYVEDAYAGDEASVGRSCGAEGVQRVSTLIKLMELDGFTRGCPLGRLLPS